VKNATLSLALRNARLQLIVDAAAGGFLDIYTGAQPASPDDAAVSQVRLASVQLENPAFTGVVDAQATLLLPSIALIEADGAGSWFRLWGGDHVTPLHDGTLGVGANFNLSVSTLNFLTDLPFTLEGWLLRG
jgi:hypothetical protein